MADSPLVDSTSDVASPILEFTEQEHPAHRRLALDGLRAVAVALVMAFHGGLTRFHGGFLGVDIFFALSGFLITSLLVAEYDQRHTINLIRFWLRRAKRLLPALAVVILAVCVGAWWFAYPGQYPDLHLDVLASFFYFANWHLIGTGTNYFQATLPPSLLTHTWSLSIEEQFYVVWPLVVVALMRWRRNARVVAAVAVVSAVASALLMAYGHAHHWPINRLYYGTDTHAEGLLIGAALAGALYGLREGGATLDRLSGQWARWLRWLGPVAMVGLLVVIAEASGDSSWLFEGGFLVVAVLTATTIAYVVTLPHSWPARALSWGPLVYVGQISYGLYLWHYPLFHWLTHGATGLSGYALFAVRCLVTFAVSVLSYHLVEMPIRRASFPVRWRHVVSIVVVVALWLAACEGIATAANAEPAAGFLAPVHVAHPVRVLFLGDSLAWTLSYYLGDDAAHYGVVDINGSVLGCGLVPSTSALESGVVKKRPGLCRRHGNGYFALETYWRQQIARDHPNVIVVLAGRWEEHNLLFRDHWRTIFDAPIRRSMTNSMTLLDNDARAAGATIVYLTMPCGAQSEDNWGAVFPENLPARQVAYNDVLRHVAQRQHVEVLNLNAKVCPGGADLHTIDGLMVRSYDGYHFAAGAGLYLAPWLFPRLLKAAEKRRG